MTRPRYTHGYHESVQRSHRRRTVANSAAYLRPHLTSGQRLLDVGSGPGTITAELAGLVSPGEVVALEHTDAAAQLTRDELDRRQVTNACVLVGDVHDLAFADDEFDVVHAHQVLQHVAQPVRALREMARVARPGGLVAVRDSDYGGFTWHPDIPGLRRWRELYADLARANGGEPDAGRRLLSWAREAGLPDVTAGASTWCFAGPTDRDWWGGLWADRVRSSALADQLLDTGRASRADLDELAVAWVEWAAAPDGWFSVLHGELIART